MLPRTAVVRYASRAWVYVQTSDEVFTRREASLVSPTPDGWFVKTGFAPGDPVVVTGAQTLLSEELKSETGEEE